MIQAGTIVFVEDHPTPLAYVVFIGGPIPVAPTFKNSGWINRDEATAFAFAMIGAKGLRSLDSLSQRAIARVDHMSWHATKYIQLSDAKLAITFRPYTVAPKTDRHSDELSTLLKTSLHIPKVDKISKADMIVHLSGDPRLLHGFAIDCCTRGLGGCLKFPHGMAA